MTDRIVSAATRDSAVASCATSKDDRERAILSRAAAIGFRLFQYETGTGRLVWEWRRGLEPRPQFVTRRVALHWMNQFLEREGAKSDSSESSR